MLRVFTLSLLLLLVLAAPPEARAQQVDRVEIVEWGIFRHNDGEVVKQPLSPLGTMTHVLNERLQHVTTTIPALAGMTFGIRYKVVGPVVGANVTLKQITRFPKQGVTNPETGKTFSYSEYHTSAVVGAVTYRGYTFDRDWEVVPGRWTLEIWHDGRKLAEKTFMVTRLVSSAELARLP
jgi:hypothetical protein